MTFAIKISSVKKLLYVAALLFLVPSLVLAVFYRFSSYSVLRDWFFSLNDCFYKRDTWAANFFTPAAKAAGDTLAMAGGVVTLALIAYVIRGWRLTQKSQGRHFTVDLSGWPWYVAVFVLAMVCGGYSWSLADPSYDEVFSAVNCAELHPIQTVSYYMLPNNHTWFNFINNILLRRLWGDTVQSGRLISLMCYAGVLLCAYHWLYGLIRQRLFALLALVPIALQFVVWGMAGQARGYEMQLLMAWIAFGTMLRYLQAGSSLALRLNTIANIIGFAMVPSYLFYYVAQLVVVFGARVIQRQSVTAYSRYQLIFGGTVFLLFLPLFYFSGTGAFFGNKYVTPAYANSLAYLPDFCKMINLYINFCFSRLCGEDRAINYVIFLLPLLLFFTKQGSRRLIAWCFVALCVAFSGLLLNMRASPPDRNLIVQYSLVMGMVVYAFFVLTEMVSKAIKQPGAKRMFCAVFFGVPVLIFSGHLLLTNRENIVMNLYSYEVNHICREHVRERTIIDAKSSIGFSEESFFLYYVFRNDHPNAHKCGSYTEDYFIKRNSEQLPEGVLNGYIKVMDLSDDHELYKRK